MTAEATGSKLWIVRRSANARTHSGPRLFWLSIALDGPKQVKLTNPYCGRITFKRSELESWGLSVTPEEAIARFRDLAEHWRESALEELGRADRDLAYANHRTIESALRAAKEIGAWTQKGIPT